VRRYHRPKDRPGRARPAAVDRKERAVLDLLRHRAPARHTLIDTVARQLDVHRSHVPRGEERRPFGGPARGRLAAVSPGVARAPAVAASVRALPVGGRRWCRVGLAGGAPRAELSARCRARRTAARTVGDEVTADVTVICTGHPFRRFGFKRSRRKCGVGMVGQTPHPGMVCDDLRRGLLRSARVGCVPRRTAPRGSCPVCSRVVRCMTSDRTPGEPVDPDRRCRSAARGTARPTAV
jgi:hypothetical protein